MIRGVLGSSLLVVALIVASPGTAAVAQAGADLHPRVAARDVRPADASDYLTNRPTAAELPQESCDTVDPICVHWTTTGRDAATAKQAQLTLTTVAHVYDTYQQADFKMPEADCDDVTVSCSSAGGSPDVDIYLADIGDPETMGGASYYGFCLPTDPVGVHLPAARDQPAYCVLDNDYDPQQFPSKTTATQDLQVTVAHEFFHAVQFAYDTGQPSWFMEATATWAEGTLYPKITDNTQFLPYGPLCFPGQSLNVDTVQRLATTTCAGLRIGLDDFNWEHVYGDWIFFRWLTDRLKSTKSVDPIDAMRQIWSATDTTTGHHTETADAIGGVLTKYGLTWAKAYALFSAANLRSRQTYTSTGHTSYPVSAPTAGTTLSSKKLTSKSTHTLPHLSSATIRFAPSRTKGTARLRIGTARSGAAVITVMSRSGRATTKLIAKSGTVGFSSAKVRYIDVTVVNASATASASVQVSARLLP